VSYFDADTRVRAPRARSAEPGFLGSVVSLAAGARHVRSGIDKFNVFLFVVFRLAAVRCACKYGACAGRYRGGDFGVIPLVTSI